MTTATRLTSNGTLLITGYFDEVTQNTISANAAVVTSSEFDEVTLASDGINIARRYTKDGKTLVYTELDEVSL
jgi:hypothetical protein